MASIRELKGRIGSVSSSEKITGAMKMISSAKLHKAMQALQRVVPFRQQIQSTIDHLLAADSEYISPLAQERPCSMWASSYWAATRVCVELLM